MLALALSALIAMNQPSTTVRTPTCSGADPAIAAVHPWLASSTPNVSRYKIGITVANVGRMKQAANVLQSVVMHQNDVKTDSKGVPPLRPGQSYTVTFTMARSSDADVNTTQLRFELIFRKPPSGAMDCNLQNDSFTLEV
jgi:CARDB